MVVQVGLDHHLHLRSLVPGGALASVGPPAADLGQLAGVHSRGVGSLALLASRGSTSSPAQAGRSSPCPEDGGEVEGLDYAGLLPEGLVAPDPENL